MRETSGFSVRPTASDSILKLRRRNNEATRFSTPGLFSTSAIKVCCMISPFSLLSLSSFLFNQQSKRKNDCRQSNFIRFVLPVCGASRAVPRLVEPSGRPLLPAPPGTPAPRDPASCAPIQWHRSLLRVWLQVWQALDELPPV